MRQWQLPLITTMFILCNHAHFLFSPKLTTEKICEGDRGCSPRCRFESPPVTACSLTDSDPDRCYKDGNFTLTAQIKGELETQLNVMLMNKEGEDLVISITNDYVKVFYERIRDSSTTALTKVDGRHKTVTLVLGSMITLVLDDKFPIVLDKNTKFNSISSIESLVNEAVTLFKTTVLQNKWEECQCNEVYPVPYQNNCYTWNMTGRMSLKVTPRVLNLRHVIKLSSSLAVTTLFYTTNEREKVDRVSVDGQENSNFTQLRSELYHEPYSRVAFMLEIESASEIEIIGGPHSALSNIKLLASCGCEECNVQSNFTRCSTNTCSDSGTCSVTSIHPTHPTPIILTKSSGNLTESARNVSEKTTDAPTMPNKKEENLTTVAPSNKTAEVLPVSPDVIPVKPVTEAAVRENSTETKVTANPDGGMNSNSTQDGSKSGVTDKVSMSPNNVTAVPTENGKNDKTSGNATNAPSGSSGNVTVAPTEDSNKKSGNVTVGPTEDSNKKSGNVTFGPTEDSNKKSGNVTVGPTEDSNKKSGNVTFGPTEDSNKKSGNVTVGPTEDSNKKSGNVTVGPTEDSNKKSGNATVAPTEDSNEKSGNVTVGPTEDSNKKSGNVTVGPTDDPNKKSGNVTVAPTDDPNKKSGNVTVAPTEDSNKKSGNVTVAPTEDSNKISGNVTVAPTEDSNKKSGNVTVAPTEDSNEKSGNVTVGPTEDSNKKSGNVTVGPTDDPNTKSGNVTVAPTDDPNKKSGNVTVAPTEDSNKKSGNVTVAPTEDSNKISGNVTVAPTEDSNKKSGNVTVAPTTYFYTGLEDFTVDKYEEGDVYTRLLDTDLTLVIRLKDRVSRTKRDETPDRNFRTLFRTFCELNNCTQMSKVDVLSYRQLDKQTIEHTDTLQSFTAYVYTFVTEDVKITKEIVTSQREPEVVDKVWTKMISEHQIQVNWEGVFRPNSRIISPGCFTVIVTAGNVTTKIKTDLTSILIEDNSGDEARSESSSAAVEQMVEIKVPSKINNTNILVEITLKTETGNVTAVSNLLAAQHSISHSVLILSIVFGVLGTLFLLLIIIYFIYRVRRNSAHSYHFNPNTLRQEYRPSEAERSKLTFNTNQSHSTIHHNRMCGQPVDPKDDGNTVFQVKRVNATENLLAGCQHSGAANVSRTPAAAAPSAPSHVTPALATVLRYERTHSEGSGTGSLTHCQTDIRDKAVTLTSQDGTSQTYL